MTREEAKKTLESIKGMCETLAEWVLTIYWGEALDMAIEALQSTMSQERVNHESTNDLISRADAIEKVHDACVYCDTCDIKDIGCSQINVLSALPSAEAKPTVIRSRTLMPTKDFKEWAKRIRETNPNAVVIPCDAEIVSAEAVQGWIPCSERLPEDSGDYLVCPSDGVIEDYSDCRDVMIMPYDADCEAFGWWTERYDPISLGFVDSDFDEFEVLAWMPLPKPYKGGEE